LGWSRRSCSTPRRQDGQDLDRRADLARRREDLALRVLPYWLNRNDDETPALLRTFSLRSLDEINELCHEHDRDRSRRTAQRELAQTMTSWIHGDAIVSRVEVASRVMFGDSLDGLTDADLGLLAGTVPTVDVPRSELVTGVGIVDLLTRTIADSKGDARRLITQGGAYINNQRVTEVGHQVTLAHLATETMLIVRGGKKDYCLVRVT